MLDAAFDQLSIFANLTTSQRALLQSIFVRRECKAEDVIFEQGDWAEYLFIVVEGEVVIRFKPEDGPALNVAHIRAGGVFGWSAAFGGDLYTSGASCVKPSTLLRVRGADLKKLRQEHPETGILILERLAAVVAERLRHTHKQVVALLEHGLTNGVKPIGGK
jgi:CRP/FNR family cyclic AMP-dependent transcriptional regulator